MDIGDWLRSLDLERYETAFRENEIDETVLASLTYETLKEIGVTAVGHRLKLLDAIAALGTEAGARPPPADATTASAAPSVRAEERAERRQVTVFTLQLDAIHARHLHVADQTISVMQAVRFQERFRRIQIGVPRIQGIE